MHIHVIMQCEFCAQPELDCGDSCYQKLLYGKIFLLGPSPGSRKGDAITAADEKARDPDGPVWLQCLECGTSMLNGKSGPNNLLKHKEKHCTKKPRPGAACDSSTVDYKDKGRARGKRKIREGADYQADIPPAGASSPTVDTLVPNSPYSDEDADDATVDVPVATAARACPQDPDPHQFAGATRGFSKENCP